MKAKIETELNLRSVRATQIPFWSHESAKNLRQMTQGQRAAAAATQKSKLALLIWKYNVLKKLQISYFIKKNTFIKQIFAFAINGNQNRIKESLKTNLFSSLGTLVFEGVCSD